MEPTSAEIGLEIIRFVSSFAYLVVGFLVARRPVDPGSRLALYGFAGWWAGLAIIGFYSVPTALGINLADQGLGVFRLYIYTLFPLLHVALAGLVYYLLYLYTGKRAIAWPIAAAYVALSIWLVYLVEGFGPYVGVGESGMNEILYTREHPPWIALAYGLALVVPPIVGALAYAALWFQVQDRESRYRIVLVSSGILVWFGYSLFNTVLSFITGDNASTFTFRLVSQLLGLVASVMVLIAFAPPRPVRRWLERAREKRAPGVA